MGGSHKEIFRCTWPLSMHVNRSTHRVCFENISWRKLFEILSYCWCVGYAIVYMNLTCIKSYQAETPSRHGEQFCVYRAVLALKISGQGENNIVRYTYLNNRFPPLHLSSIACCLLSTYIILQAFQFQIICIFIRCIPSVHRESQRQELI